MPKKSPYRPLRQGIPRAIAAGCLVVGGHAVWADSLPPIANVVIGGAERRCSSFSGDRQGGECLADWNTILAQDPAFKGITREDISFDAEVFTPTFTYSLTQTRVDGLRHVPARLFDARRKSLLLARLTQALQASGPREHLAWPAFEGLLPQPTDGHQERLTLAEGAILRSVFVDPMPHYRRKLQGRSTLFSSNPHSVAITTAVVAAARAINQGKKPLIGVVTASAGLHPFADRDLNVFMLQSAGADVVYLPLNGGSRQALDADDCANLRYYYDSYTNTKPERVVYHADLLFPDLAQQQQALCANQGQALNALLGRLNGIYFSGGNQARHLESLVTQNAAGDYSLPSAQLAILQRRHAQGQLVVAGTSAGNHIQGGGLWQGKPVPMVGGGSSYDALKNGFTQGHGVAGDTTEPGQTEHNTNFPPVIYPLGGLGVFRFGVLDSHFSRRAREGRLVRATFDSGMHYGFGVDENTALLVSQADAHGTTHFAVIGAGGVFIADVRHAKSQSDSQRQFSINGVRAHYLLPGDTARIDTKGDLLVTLSNSRPVLPAAPAQATVVQDRLMDSGAYNFLNLATTMGRTGATHGFGSTHNSADAHTPQNKPYYSATLARDAHTVFRAATALDSNTSAAVAYTGLLVQFAPCADACQPPKQLQAQ